MLVQRVVSPMTRQESWMVLGDDDVPVAPIERYLSYLTDIERSPNTVKAYAHDPRASLHPCTSASTRQPPAHPCRRVPGTRRGPFEVALWARHGGPIVVAPDRDGFREQIEHGVTGLLYDPAMPSTLTDTMVEAIELPDDDRHRIRTAAERRVQGERDVVANLGETLRVLWAAPPRLR